jgi:hypothetical protein
VKQNPLGNKHSIEPRFAGSLPNPGVLHQHHATIVAGEQGAGTDRRLLASEERLRSLTPP